MSDAHGLGDPPRALTENMRRYILTASATLFGMWVAASVLFTITHVVTIVASGSLYFPPVLPIVFIGLAVVSARKGAEQRRRITRVITEGALMGAAVRDVQQIQHRRGVTTTVTYRVEGTERDVQINGEDQALAFLQVGLRDEVLYLATEPDLIVPTFLIAKLRTEACRLTDAATEAWARPARAADADEA